MKEVWTNARLRQMIGGAATGLLGALLAGCGAAGAQGPGPNDPEARMRPELLDVSASTVEPGETIQVRFPEETSRGVAWVLEEQDSGTWHVRYYMAAVTDGYDGGGFPSWWSADDTEGKGWPDIGVGGGGGPDTLTIPDSIRSGTYRLCTANSMPNICTRLDVRG